MSENKLYFTKDHEWLRIEGDNAYVGITKYAQGELGDIIFVELPDVGNVYSSKDIFGTIEAVKTVADLYMPVSAEIIQVNENLEDAPELINSSPESDGWIVKIKINDNHEIEKLLNKDSYEDFIG